MLILLLHGCVTWRLNMGLMRRRAINGTGGRSRFALGLIPPGEKEGAVPDLHQPTFNFNDAAIPIGIEIFCRLALRK